MRLASQLLLAAGIAAVFASPARAQVAPIKPGLWETQVEREGGGQKMPDLNEHLKNMPPEQRKRMEAMMKERGVDMSGGMNKIRICFDKESLDQGRWKGEQDTRCKTDMSNRGSSWKWHSVCGEPYHSVTDGEATFSNAESYVVKTSTTMTIRGETKTTQNTIRSKWLGADCGDVKPIQALKQPLPQAPKQK